MTSLLDELSPDQRLALAYGPASFRDAMAAILCFDHNLGRAVAMASQPLIGQVRLAWWREQARAISQSADVRDPCLLAMKELVQSGRVTNLQMESLVDAWEDLLDDEADPATILSRFGEMRGLAVFGMAAGVARCSDSDVIAPAGRLWALVDFARHAGDRATAERAFAIAAEGVGVARALPRAMRSFAILARFAERDLRRGTSAPVADGSPVRILEAWGLLLGRS